MAKSWITSCSRTPLKIKKYITFFHKKYVKSRSLYYHQKFKLYRNNLNRLNKINTTDYYNKYFTLNKKNMRNILRGIKQIISLMPMSGGGFLQEPLRVIMY